MTDLSGDLAGLQIEGRRKKRTQRAFHDPHFMPPQQPFAGQPPVAFPSPALSSGGNGNGFGNASPGSAHQAAFFTPAQPSTPVFGSFAAEQGTPNWSAHASQAGSRPVSHMGSHHGSQGFASQPNLHSPQQTHSQAQRSQVSQQPPSFQGMGMGIGTALTVTNPAEMSQVPPAELSLSAARHASQQEYTTPAEADGGCRSFLSFENILPPLAGTQFHAVDQGTATPRHIRSTMYNVPESEQLRKQTRLPVAVTIRPFAPVPASESPVPVTDLSVLGAHTATDQFDVGPPRCNRCRTYINPAMMHTHSGRFTCNVCQFPNNHVPHEYVATIDPMSNMRVDREQRPELHRGVYDIIVPKYYNVGGADCPAQGLHHVFLVDISHHSISKQLPTLLADAMRTVVFDYNATEDSRPLKFAVILFDTRMHFFNLSAHLDAAQMVISGDLDDPFVPFSDGLFADPETCSIAIEDALNKIEALSSAETPSEPEPCFSVALRTAAMCLEQVGGGKITAVLSALSSWGPGRSKIKENRAVGRAQSAEVEKAMYSPDNEYYKLLAKDLVKGNVGLDVFIVCDTPADVSNIGWLASITGGNVHKWANFSFERDGRSLTAQIVASVKKCTGYQGQLKLRCSNGLQVAQYYGFPAGDSGVVGLVNASSQDPVIPVLNEDQTFTVLLEYDGQLNTKYDCHFQAAILYTDPHGVRKVRVINLVLAVSERLPDVFSFIDQDAVVTTIVRDTISFIGKESITELRKSLSEKLVDIFTAYRAMSEQNHNRASTMTNQLIFPDSLKHLPSFFLSLIKTKALRDSSAVSSDSRLCDIYQMLYMPVEKLVYHLYPALVELHSLEDEEGVYYEDHVTGASFMRLPEFKSLSTSVLECGVYILCDGTTVYVSVHPDSNKLLLKDVFGEHVETINDVDPLLDALPELDTHISMQARNLVQYFHTSVLGSNAIGASAIVIVREGVDALMQEFKDRLIEDKLASKALNTAPNYTEFLASLHKAVKVKLDSAPKARANGSAALTNETLAQRMIHF